VPISPQKYIYNDIQHSAPDPKHPKQMSERSIKHIKTVYYPQYASKENNRNKAGLLMINKPSIAICMLPTTTEFFPLFGLLPIHPHIQQSESDDNSIVVQAFGHLAHG
jgi:hypothetical protein